jgi:dihydroorotate dehydrogenase (fumarate)
MHDLSVKYMGFELENPIIVSSSGLTSTKEKVLECVKNGAGAVVLKSLFEEQIMNESKNEAEKYDVSYHTEAMAYIDRMTFEQSIGDYLKLIEGCKKEAGVPVIASLNGSTLGGWMEFAKRIEEAGADALELNIFIVPHDINYSGKDIEDTYVKIFKGIKKSINIPVAVKLGPYFTNFGNIAKRISDEGASSIVLFNRFQTVNVDESDTKKPELTEGKWLSYHHEAELSKRWISMLYCNLKSDLSATSGIRTGEDVIDAIKCGASAVQLVSALYLNGLSHISKIKEEMKEVLKKEGRKGLSDIKGLSCECKSETLLFTRGQYFAAISELNKIK